MEECPLNVVRVEQPRATINRIQAFLHGALILALLYYRVSMFPLTERLVVKLAWAVVFASEVLLSFLWLLNRAYRWRPVTRTVFPERLPEDEQLPAIDVFVCTADPVKEPAVDVMNTVISAMALDYPEEKLSVYVSDDGGSPVTLYALRQAATFAKSWLPFCKKYRTWTRCPKAYFSAPVDDDCDENTGFSDHKQQIEMMYEKFKDQLRIAAENSTRDHGFHDGGKTQKDRPPLIEVIHENGGKDILDNEKAAIPMLVYVSREKSHLHHHHFKAGALNVLLRVSSILSNSPYALILDCDMYSNDPSSARQAMCFHLDHQLSPSLAFVQFPQDFHSIGNNDIYDGGMRWVFETLWKGCDGLKGPLLSGSNFYIKREALYGTSPGDTMNPGINSADVRHIFGPSNELIMSMRQNSTSKAINKNQMLLQEALFLASCTYEKETRWGEQVGFLYDSVLEDLFTGFNLHSRGWISIYCHPAKPSFLGTSPTNLNVSLIQNKRWACGLLQVAFHRFFPLAYELSRKSVLQTMCYGFLAFQPLYSFFVLCYSTIPQICLLNGISLYPQVSDPWFAVFLVTFTSSLYQHVSEVLSTGGSLKTYWNEQRFWMIKAASAYVLACLNTTMKIIGGKQVNFHITDKVVDDEQIKRYTKGTFDFSGATFLLVLLVTLVILNMISFIGGVGRMVVEGGYSQMSGQILLTFFILANGYPIIEGISIRKDAGRVPTSSTILSVIIAAIFLLFGYIALSL